jgi:predicted nucleic acid-binding protein
MGRRLLFDTDVLIDYLRGHVQAVAYLESCSEELLISAATVAELFARVREGAERTALQNFQSVFQLIPIDGEIAETGGLLRRDYGRSYNTGLVDALIAATALVNDAQLVTLNRKHFPMLDGVVVPYGKQSAK